MFVRWQTYPLHLRWNKERARLKAILVESVRVDGKPRQKHIAFLSSIASDSLGKPGPRFWCEVASKLKRLGNRIGPEDYERIMASIAVKVGGPPMTEAELEQFERECEQFFRPSPASHLRAPRPPPRRRRPLRDRVEEAKRKYTELQFKLDLETLDATYRKRP
jgi:hypothetical protein